MNLSSDMEAISDLNETDTDDEEVNKPSGCADGMTVDFQGTQQVNKIQLWYRDLSFVGFFTA